MVDPILIAKNDKNEIYLLPRLANRHGLIAAATGTGRRQSPALVSNAV
jgi:hypothetical protein